MKALNRIAFIAGLAMCISVSMAPGAHATTIKDLQDALNALQAVVSAQAAQISALSASISALQAKDVTQDGDIAGLQSGGSAQNADIAGLKTDVADIKSSSVYKLKDYVSVDTSSTIESQTGLKGPHIIITGANVHIRSGSGATYEGTNLAPGIPLTGLGNLVVGYNEPRGLISGGPVDVTKRGGAHNLIVGPFHQYSSVGGVVAGLSNTVSGFCSSITGGWANIASGSTSSVSGGVGNTASGDNSGIAGGVGNTASGIYSCVSGGQQNVASGVGSSISGGWQSTASGSNSSVSGGRQNTASSTGSSVGGGWYNIAGGSWSLIDGNWAIITGGVCSSVSGGFGLTNADQNGWAAGGEYPVGPGGPGVYHTP